MRMFFCASKQLIADLQVCRLLQETGNKAVESGHADLVVYGRHW
jgi:hypothetical protein